MIRFLKSKEEILERRILVTNRHERRNEEIIVAYRGQSKVEYTFKIKKNGRNVKYQMEEIHISVKKLLKPLEISPDNLRPNISLSFSNVTNTARKRF